ncbi:MAG TPA: hypothetical protein VHM31_04080 [Polyangia bacterium]|nr:hypothetical protein [Polyangia bacterium]
MASRLRARLIAAVLVFEFAAPAAVAAAPPAAPPAAADADNQPDLVDEPAPAAPKDLWYGAAARLRWVSVPKWLLNAFTKENVPLSSWATGLELFRRKGNFEFAVAFSYQNMSPPDGNWLGSSANPLTETNFVHFDNFAMYGIDASLLWHTYINDWFGLRYGAGFGIGILGGHITRTYARNGQCTAENAANTSVCAPGPNDQPFTSGSVPPAVPILNVDLGVNFRIPRAKGLEVRLDGGFYDAFFLGGAIAYAY